MKLEKCLCGSKWELFRENNRDFPFAKVEHYYLCSSCEKIYDVIIFTDNNFIERLFCHVGHFDVEYYWFSDQKLNYTEIYDLSTYKTISFPFLLSFNLSVTKLKTLLLFS